MLVKERGGTFLGGGEDCRGCRAQKRGRHSSGGVADSEIRPPIQGFCPSLPRASGIRVVGTCVFVYSNIAGAGSSLDKKKNVPMNCR